MKYLYCFLIFLVSLPVLAEGPKISVHLGEGCGSQELDWPHHKPGVKLEDAAAGIRLDLLWSWDKITVYDPNPEYSFEVTILSRAPLRIAFRWFDFEKNKTQYEEFNLDSFVRLNAINKPLVYLQNMRSPQFVATMLWLMSTFDSEDPLAKTMVPVIHTLFSWTYSQRDHRQYATNLAEALETMNVYVNLHDPCTPQEE